MTATHVYRCFDRSGRLIYVGMTKHLFARLDIHYRTTWWAPQVVHVTAKVYQDRDSARHVERNAILREHPRWNVLGYRETAS